MYRPDLFSKRSLSDNSRPFQLSHYYCVQDSTKPSKF
ncbi:hypothetical protein BVRB_024940 [Beta vulgaris subsp. vulgaris]|uniref:Uncharacterized protein n=1 Tax=Beta vulgaris subsp. vulgaris TaxID=3555 RepID=A0A0J8AZE6_BETVV|nr:hypothetical protein BVRB_024940 [Beta vulgaris subsp. vulgaris]